MSTEVADTPCPACGLPIGDHRIRDAEKCGYSMPLEDFPDGARHEEPEAVAAVVSVLPGFFTTAAGRFPILQFRFDSHPPTPGITLMLDATRMHEFRRLVSTSVDRAVLAARRGR